MLGRVIIAATLISSAGCTLLGDSLFGPAPPADDGPSADCGDGTCGAGEDCASCESDCGTCSGEVPTCDPNPPPPPQLVDYATRIEPLITERCAGCHFDGGFPPDLTTMAGLQSVLEPCNCTASKIAQKISPEPPYGDRMPQDGPPYLSAEQIATICDWIDEGARAVPDAEACGPLPECTPIVCGDATCDPAESCANCPADCGICPPDDTDPPAFSGVVAVTKLTSNRCRVTWNEADDELTATEQLTYRVYGGWDGTIDWSWPIAEVDGNTEALVTFDPGLRYPIGVRAVDAAGNEDVNTRARACDLL